MNNVDNGMLISYVVLNKLDKMIELIDKGGDIRHTNTSGETLLHFAVYHDRLHFLPYLISKGLDVNLQNKEGDTPLTYAAEHGYISCAKFLLENGADGSIVGRNNATPLDRAKLNETQEIAKMIEDYAKAKSEAECLNAIINSDDKISLVNF